VITEAAMAVTRAFREYVVEQLGRITPLTHRAMFGGVGLYAGGIFFGLIDDDTVYFKVDDVNRGDYERAGMAPFAPYGDGRVMQYYAVPGEVFEDVEVLSDWLARALDAARRKRSRG
jgi:DNA transformation protein and related proteins